MLAKRTATLTTCLAAVLAAATAHPAQAQNTQDCRFVLDGHRILASLERADPQAQQPTACEIRANVYEGWVRGHSTAQWDCEEAEDTAAKGGELADCWYPFDGRGRDQAQILFRYRRGEPPPQDCRDFKTAGYRTGAMSATGVSCGAARAAVGSFFRRCRGRRVCTVGSFICHPNPQGGSTYAAWCASNAAVVDIDYTTPIVNRSCPGNIYLGQSLGAGDLTTRYITCRAARAAIRRNWYLTSRGWLRLRGWRCRALGPAGVEDYRFRCRRGRQALLFTFGP